MIMHNRLLYNLSTRIFQMKLINSHDRISKIRMFCVIKTEYIENCIVKNDRNSLFHIRLPKKTKENCKKSAQRTPKLKGKKL